MPKQEVWAVRIATVGILMWAAASAVAQPYTLPSGQTVAPLETFRECDVCPEVIVLPREQFKMGAEPWESELVSFQRSPSGEPIGYQHEGPVHRVEMDLHLAMGRNEVTYDEWMVCVADGGCSYTPPDTLTLFLPIPLNLSGRHPVMGVSYFDVLEYAAWINARVGAPVYRLPTEAEWEFAARAGTTTRFAQGDRLTPEQASYSEGATARSEDRPEPSHWPGEPQESPVPVDTLDAANGWGLRHMSGNALEITMSCRSERHLGLPTASAYLADALEAQSCRRVTKSGDFLVNMFLTRPAGRGSTNETSRAFSGFRLVREMMNGTGEVE